MFYTFNITNSENKNVNKIYKKITRIQFFSQHKLIILLSIMFVIFLGISLFSEAANFFKGHGLLELAFCWSSALFLMSLYDFISDEKGTYKKMSNALDCSIFVKDIILKVSESDETIDDVEVPTLDIKYDTNHSNGKVAILLRINDDKYKIISFIDNKEKGKNKLYTVPSSNLKRALMELSDMENLVFLNICQISSDKKEGDYVSPDEMDVRSIITETLFVERN